jgi:expansin (peptidoglycan-binding protein)
MSTGVGSLLEALLAVAYGLAPNPISATIVYGVMDGATGMITNFRVRTDHFVEH